MSDIEFRQTREFKGLDGQSPPKGDLLERVFGQARFDTRFYEEVGGEEGDNTAASGTYTSYHAAQIPPSPTLHDLLTLST
jgi:hypothetical protein